KSAIGSQQNDSSRRYRPNRSFCSDISGNFVPGGDYGAAAKKPVQVINRNLKHRVFRVETNPLPPDSSQPPGLLAVALPGGSYLPPGISFPPGGRHGFLPWNLQPPGSQRQ